MCSIRSLVLVLLVCSAALSVSAQRSGNGTSPWKTLNGNAPLVVARGGFSGLFPDSSAPAYGFVGITSLPNTILWCDVQLTKDGVGICFPDLLLNNASNVDRAYPNRTSSYLVNGISTTGYFSVDFSLKDLEKVLLFQGVFSRSDKFDNQFPIQTIQDVAQPSGQGQGPPSLWLNVQHDGFFNQFNLSMRTVVLSVTRSVIINYISSPEVNFLRSILARKPSTTKLVLRFLGRNEIDPSTNLTYSSLLGNLTFVKTFASGILVPKYYIWPVDGDLYLQTHTSLVSDAHKEGLEVFASDFANDVPFAYNYSYDPVAEYLSFIDNGDFSVDGLLSDFPITPSNAIDCFSHIGKNGSGQAKPLVISYKGASGDYPDCTDLAYAKAISDGVDVVDCPVQMTKDGIPICLGSIDLLEISTVAQSTFSTLSMSIPELKSGPGIFTFNLTRSQIQNLTPSIANPYIVSTLYRNPKFKNAGKFLTLSEFLAFTKNTSVSGVLISIENAAYLAEKQGLSVIDAVLGALTDSGYKNQTVKKVMIKSTDSSVLVKFKEESDYELVYHVDETIRDALNSTILDIKKFANSVVVTKASVFPDHSAFLAGMTDVVTKLQAFDLPVYVQLFRNEFLSQAWDFFADPIVEINNYFTGAGVNGIVSDFPGTAVKYRNNRCLALAQTPPYMATVQPGGLLGFIAPPMLPPAEAPSPVLTEDDVNEPPLPSVVERNQTDIGGGGTTAAPTPAPNGQQKTVARFFISNLAILIAALLLF